MNSTAAAIDVVVETTCDACGYAAAVLAAVCLGTIGVPIRSELVARLDVDVLVMQSYKTTVAFIATWLATIASRRPPRLTSWGIISGLFSVPGGLASVYGIRNAGLAVSVGLYSSTIVLTSFVWGVFVFEEGVGSRFGACCACATLMAGLMGMAAYSEPSPRPARRRDVGEGTGSNASGSAATTTTTTTTKGETHDEEDVDGVRKRKRRPSTDTAKRIEDDVVASTNDEAAADASSSHILPLEIEHLLDGKDDAFPDKRSSTVSFSGGKISLTRRQTGILASVIGGAWGGMNLVPLHFAAEEGYGGPSYVVSFFSGCMFVIVALWIARFLFELYRLEGAIGKSYRALPSFHVRQMWLHGGLTGLLLSLGKFMTIIAVVHLGNSVGNCFAQASMLVSGLWGIFRFKEIEGRERILKWLSSACIALTGILWLSYEHAS